MTTTRKLPVLTIDMSAPLPLGYHEALRRGLELREADPVVFTWAVLAVVIRTYHGFDRSARWWQRSLRGLVPARPRGVPLNGSRPKRVVV